jgi:hypothetical protein
VTTYAIHTSSHAARYARFIPDYWAGIESLERQPDQIVLLIHEDDEAGLADSIPARYKSIVRIEWTRLPHSSRMINEQIRLIEADWVCFCGLDDVALPSAYNELDGLENVEILVGNLQLSSGGEIRGQWNPDELKRHNTLPNHSPYRKSLWDRVGGWPEIYWADWGFWMKCAMAGATVERSTNFQARFHTGELVETDSGPLLDPAVRAAANQEILDFGRSIGFL